MFSIEIHATPGAKKDRIGGEHDGRLRVHVTAPADKGKANKAIQTLLAKTFGVAKSAVQLQSGASSRQKRFLIDVSEADGRSIVEQAKNNA